MVKTQLTSRLGRMEKLDKKKSVIYFILTEIIIFNFFFSNCALHKKSYKDESKVNNSAFILEKEIPIKDIKELRLKNYSGQVNIIGGERDSILIRAKRQRLDVEVKISKEFPFLEVETKYRKKGGIVGFVSQFFRHRDHSSVIYEAYIPSSLAISVDTFFADINIKKMKGLIKAKSFHGNVFLDLSSLKQNKGVSLESFHGNIKVDLYEGISAKIHMETKSKVFVNFKVSSWIKKNGDEIDFELNGGGNQIIIKNYHGDIYLTKLSERKEINNEAATLFR